jgi:hypothetical protein
VRLASDGVIRSSVWTTSSPKGVSVPRNQAWACCSCINNPHRGGRNWSRAPDFKATLVRPPGLRVDGVAVRAGHSASLDSSAIVHAVTIHIEEAEIGRSIRPPRARCAPAMRPLALPGTPATPKAIPGRLITLGIGEEAAATARLHLRVHAPAIHIEVPEIGRLDPPPKALVHP